MIAFVNKLALDAGSFCLSKQHKLTLSDIDYKFKKDLVVAVDKKIARFIIHTITENFSGHGVLGEESGRSDKASELRDIRRFGSTALDLCHVACVRLDGYWEMNLNLYDVATGMLIVEEAGGKLCDLTGGTNIPENGIMQPIGT